MEKIKSKGEGKGLFLEAIVPGIKVLGWKNALRVREPDDTFSDNRIEARSNGSRSWRFLKCAERPAHEKEIAKSEIKKWSKSLSELLHFLLNSQ